MCRHERVNQRMKWSKEQKNESRLYNSTPALIVFFMSTRPLQGKQAEVAESKMLRFGIGVMRMNRIRNEFIRGKAREAILHWFGSVGRGF